MCARLLCQRCVGSHVLFTCRRLYFVVAVGGFANVFFLILGIRVIETCFSGSVCFSLAACLRLITASFFFCLTFLDRRFVRWSDLAVSSRSLSFLEGVFVRLLTVGVLSSFIYNRLISSCQPETGALEDSH